MNLKLHLSEYIIIPIIKINVYLNLYVILKSIMALFIYSCALFYEGENI